MSGWDQGRISRMFQVFQKIFRSKSSESSTLIAIKNHTANEDVMGDFSVMLHHHACDFVRRCFGQLLRSVSAFANNRGIR